MLWPLCQMLLVHQKVLGATNTEAVLSAGAVIVLVGQSAGACRSHWDSAAGKHALWSHPTGPGPKVPTPLKLSSTSLWLRHWASYQFSLLTP